MMTAAAELLRAADGAGLPARSPRSVERDEDDGGRQIWHIEGKADFRGLTGPTERARFRLNCDPDGTSRKRNLDRDRGDLRRQRGSSSGGNLSCGIPHTAE
jgi:hypothetical protein